MRFEFSVRQLRPRGEQRSSHEVLEMARSSGSNTYLNLTVSYHTALHNATLEFLIVTDTDTCQFLYDISLEHGGFGVLYAAKDYDNRIVARSNQTQPPQTDKLIFQTCSLATLHSDKLKHWSAHHGVSASLHVSSDSSRHTESQVVTSQCANNLSHKLPWRSRLCTCKQDHHMTM